MNEIAREILLKYPDETLFQNAVMDFVDSIEEHIEPDILKLLLYPERTIIFRVPWVDRHGRVQVNYGYRVQYNSALGPYKGGLRFDPSVDLDVMKFLAFEQTFKNALTGLGLGGAKGGSDFNPKDKTEMEIMMFCQSFMTELSKHIGSETDIPAGDIGVGKREIGYLFGQYKRLTNSFSPTLTSKNIEHGGALARTEATGYGLVYMVDALLDHHHDSFEDKNVVISGSGNVAIYAALKVNALGGRVIAMSDRSGYVYKESGLDILAIQKHKESGKKLSEISDPSVRFVFELPIWNVPCDIALPCAHENEVNELHVISLIENGCKVIAEGANRPLTTEAIEEIMKSDIMFIPGKAANAGGVVASGIEMRQNAQFEHFSFEHVDRLLEKSMYEIFKDLVDAAESLGERNNYLKAANYLAYKRLETSIKSSGVI